MYKYFSNIIVKFLNMHYVSYSNFIALRGQVLIYDQIEIAHKIFT